MADLQEQAHGTGHDYDSGSPHLRHPRLRNEIIARIRALVAEQFERRGSCRVLEIGAGHGSFTDHIAAMGAQVTVTEMSRPSLEHLEARFAYNPSVRLLYDADGEAAFPDDAEYDLVLCISVLHHIPDYLTVRRAHAGPHHPGRRVRELPGPAVVPTPVPAEHGR